VFGNSWRVGRLLGVEIRIDVSWVFIALLIAYTLFLRFTIVFPELETGVAVVLGVVFAVLFFASVLIHELAHALMAERNGIPVKSITLFLFGGATHAKVEAKGPGAEFIIAVVGPLTSLGLALVFGAVGYFGEGVLAEPLAAGFLYLGFVNALLAVFNLVPGFPLDGGRVLRAAIWRATGSLSRATRIAAAAGQGVGYLMIAGGVLLLFQGIFTGIWFAAIGWFLAQAARMSHEQMHLRRMLEGVEAEDVMVGDLVPIPSRLTLQEAVDEFFMRHDHGAFPVRDGDETVGLISLRRVKQVPRDDWPTTRVREVMGPIDDQCTVRVDTPVASVLEKLEDHDAHRVLVMEDGLVVGIITASDLARWLRRRQAIEA
jgi:Zn-dependent protease/predicted transcriptional regulator